MKTTKKGRYYRLLAIRIIDNRLSSVDLPGEYIEYSEACDTALQTLLDTEFTISIVIYSNKGTVINLNREHPIYKEQSKQVK